MQVAREIQAIEIPRALDDLWCRAHGARQAGQPPPKLAPVKREMVRLREEVTWTLRTAGFAQARVAHELGVSQPAVCKILRRVERRVLARLEADVRGVKARQSAQLEYVVDQALRAWKGSQERLEESESTMTDLVGREKCVRRSMTRRGPGDPRYLVVALQALASERALWGLDRAAAPGDDPSATIQATRIESLTVRGPCASCRGAASLPLG